jgi:ubiquinone/menaquinone biosynthesis C-methylase UbiE
MATTEQNRTAWNEYDWPSGGDEWSESFGGSEASWFFVIYPRIHRFIPSGTILEIAPGFGRWTQFLKTQCQSMIAVDLSETCIKHCKTRFASDTHIRFHINDGSSLAAVPDNSIDFVFSFDSLVHVEKDVMEAYVSQLSRKLTKDGIGFVHHSNLGAYRGRLGMAKCFRKLRSMLGQKLFSTERISSLLSLNAGGGRASSMTAKLFREYCEKASLKCIDQELLNWWTGTCLIDAFSVFTKPNSSWDKGITFVENFEFVETMHLTSRLAKLYCTHSSGR